MNQPIDFVKLVKEKINIIDIIAKDLKLIKSGSNYKALCPFHEEKTPSFTINTQKQNYTCYGCGKSGDIFSLLLNVPVCFIPYLSKTSIVLATPCVPISVEWLLAVTKQFIPELIKL